MVKNKTNWRSFFKKGSLFLFLFLAGAAASGFYLQHESKSSLYVQGYPTLKYQGFTMVYDSRSKSPLWTKEHLTRKNLEKAAARYNMHFMEDPQIYAQHRSTLSDYYHSGYDRGHMVPAGDQMYHKEALKETFFLSNICPQDPQLNRGYWARLEEHVRALTIHSESVDVISGPAYLPENGEMRYPVIGKSGVWVPTHFYKVVQVNEKGKSRQMAYLVPNRPIHHQTPLEKYEVTVQQVESATGLQFHVPGEQTKTLAALIKESI